MLITTRRFAGFDSSEQLKAALQSARKTLKLSTDAPLPIGIGFLGWICDMTEVSEDPRIPVVLAEKPTLIYFAFGNDLEKYIKQVREYDAKREHKTTIVCCVNSVEEAKRAANEWKVDILSVQGLSIGRSYNVELLTTLNLLCFRFRSRWSR